MKKAPRFISRERLYDALALAAGGALLLGLSPGFNKVAPPEGAPDIADLVQVDTVTDSHGRTVYIPVMSRENYETWRDTRPLTDTQSLFHQPKSLLTDELSTVFQSRGLSEDQARTAAFDIAYNYTAQRFDLEHSVTPFDNGGPMALRSNIGTPEASCAIINTSNAYDANDWVRGFLDYPMSHINLPYDFTPEFSAFILNHERAHCMGADEAQADAAAARLLLKHHPDKKRALAFVRLFADLRTIVEVRNAMPRDDVPPDSYSRSGTALDRVAAEFTTTGRIQMTEAQIWSLAQSERFLPDPQRQAAATAVFAEMAYLLADKKFEQLSPQLRQSILWQTREYVDFRFTHALERIDAALVHVADITRQPSYNKSFSPRPGA